MEEEKYTVASDGRADRAQLDSAITDTLSSIGVQQAEGIAALCNMKGLRRVFGDAELMRTAEYFISNSLNISAAARALYMHRNTMMYRLDKIRRLTGLDIRVFDEALAFRLLYYVYAYGGKK